MNSSKPSTVPLAQLRFDPENPRLPSDRRDLGEDEIIQWMLKDANILDLMQSIATTGYSNAEPLLVIPVPDGSYSVVEGNRRLAALKLLQDPTRAKLRKKAVIEITEDATYKSIEDIPVIIYNQRSDILDYLGYRHITGIKAWGPRQKAEYLKQLFDTHSADGKSFKSTITIISKMIGTKPFYAKRLLQTLAVAHLAEENGFWGSDKLDSQIDSHFSVLHTALSYENIRSYIGIDDSSDLMLEGLNNNNIKDILEWVCGSQKLISDSRELKRLNNVVGSSSALAKLKAGLSLEIAAEYSGEALEVFRSFIHDTLAKLTEADRLISKIYNFDQEDIRLTKEVAALSRKIFRSVEDAQRESDI